MLIKIIKKPESKGFGFFVFNHGWTRINTHLEDVMRIAPSANHTCQREFSEGKLKNCVVV